MTKSELSKLIKRGESQTVSLKALRGKPSTLARPMASFSNTNDGLLIVGVDDKTRKIRGARQLSRERKVWTISIRPPGSAASPMWMFPRLRRLRPPTAWSLWYLSLRTLTAYKGDSDLLNKGDKQTKGTVLFDLTKNLWVRFGEIGKCYE